MEGSVGALEGVGKGKVGLGMSVSEHEKVPGAIGSCSFRSIVPVTLSLNLLEDLRQVKLSCSEVWPTIFRKDFRAIIAAMA